MGNIILDEVVTSISTPRGALETLEGIISFCNATSVTYIGDDITYEPKIDSLVLVLKELGENEERIALAQQASDSQRSVVLANIEEIDAVVTLIRDYLHGTTPTYEPDSDDNLLTIFTKMTAAASLMFLELNRAGYCNPDARGYHTILRQLYERCRSSAPMTQWTELLPENTLDVFDAMDWLLSAVDIEVAVQDHDYRLAIHATERFYQELASPDSTKETLRQMFSHSGIYNDIMSFRKGLKFQETLIYSLQPLVDWVENLRQQPFEQVDWLSVLRALGETGRYYSGISFFSTEEFPDEFYEERSAVEVNGQLMDMHDYWMFLIGWHQGMSSLSETRDEVLALLTRREDIEAEGRLSQYFFDTQLWEVLSRRARAAFISADRAWVSGTRSRIEEIPNYLQVGTEDIFYHHFWSPLLQWAEREPKASLRDLREIEDRLNGKAPGLAEYRQLLLTDVAHRFLRHIGIEGGSDGMRLLTDAKRIPSDLQNLFNVRNDAQHNPDADISPDILRELYARFLGINRKGVLPELVRLLTRRSRRALGSGSGQ